MTEINENKLKDWMKEQLEASRKISDGACQLSAEKSTEIFYYARGIEDILHSTLIHLSSFYKIEGDADND